jgi:hypothetical protein
MNYDDAQALGQKQSLPVPAIGLLHSARKEIAPPDRSLRPGWQHLLLGAAGVPLWLPVFD